MLAARRQWTAFCWGIAVCVGVYVAVGLVGSVWDEREAGSRGYQPLIHSQSQQLNAEAIPSQRLQSNGSLNPQIPLERFLIHLPHLHDARDIQPIIHLAPTRPRSPRILFGIPTVNREKKDYLRRALSSLLNNLQPVDADAVAYTVMFAERDPKIAAKRVDSLIRWLRLKFPEYIERGLVTVISVPAHFYPPRLDQIPPTLNDSQKRMVWRTKQSLDFAYLMSFAVAQYPNSDYYAQLEDDVVTVKDYSTLMLRFADAERFWLTCDFTTLGFIGKLFHTRDLPLFVDFTMINYKAKPIDWILEQLFDNIYCGPETGRGFKTPCRISKSHRRVHKRPLFQHIGWYSSLDGKIQKLKVRGFSGALNQGGVADDPEELERLAAEERLQEEGNAREEAEKRRDPAGSPQKPVVGSGRTENNGNGQNQPSDGRSGFGPGILQQDIPRNGLTMPPAAALANLALNFMGSMGAAVAGAAADDIPVNTNLDGTPRSNNSANGSRNLGNPSSSPLLPNAAPNSALMPGQAVDLANMALSLLNPVATSNPTPAAGPQPMDLADMALGLMGVPPIPAPASPNSPPTVPQGPAADLPRLIGSLMQSAQTGQPMSLQDTVAAIGAAQQLMTAVPGLQELVANQQIDPLTAIQGLQEVFGGGATPGQVAEGIQRMMGGIAADAAATLATAAMQGNMGANYGNMNGNGTATADGKPVGVREAAAKAPEKLKSKSGAAKANQPHPKTPTDSKTPEKATGAAKIQSQPSANLPKKTDAQSAAKKSPKLKANLPKPTAEPPILEAMPVEPPPAEKPKGSLATSDVVQLLDVLESPANVQRVLDGDQQKPKAKRKPN